jgi:hypothetical protein
MGITGGPAISISRITGRKREWYASLYRGNIQYDPGTSFADDPTYTSTGFVSSTKAKGTETQIEIGFKKFFTGNGRNFAPVGSYYRLAMSINSYSLTTPEYTGIQNPKEVISEVDFGVVSPGLVFGLGRDFRLSDRLFMGFGAKINLFGVEEPTLPYDPDMTFFYYNLNRNWIIAEYSLMYLF